MKALSLRIDDQLATILEADVKTAGSITAAVEGLIADGLKLRMQENAPAVHPHFLANLTPDGIIAFYGHFLEAVRLRAGLMNDDGSMPAYRFEQAPAGGAWEKAGLTGAWAVLHISERFTVNGIEHSVITDEEPIL